jgi:hypothetical protein
MPELEIRVTGCPLMIEDKATLTWVTLEFCNNCEYHYHTDYFNLNVGCRLEDDRKEERQEDV